MFSTDPLWVTAILTGVLAIANCCMAIGGIGLLILTLLINVKRRPRTEVEIIDEYGNARNECYYGELISTIGKRAYCYVICFRLTLFQYDSSSQLTNLRFRVKKGSEVLERLAITNLALKGPDVFPTDRISFAGFLKVVKHRDLLDGKMSEYVINGFMSKELIAVTLGDIVFIDPSDENISAEFSFTVGVKQFGPYELRLKRLF